MKSVSNQIDANGCLINYKLAKSWHMPQQMFLASTTSIDVLVIFTWV